MGNPLLGIQ